jgi:hypothetical protein
LGGSGFGTSTTFGAGGVGFATAGAGGRGFACAGFGGGAGFPAAAGAAVAIKSTVTTPGSSAGWGVGIHSSATATRPWQKAEKKIQRRSWRRRAASKPRSLLAAERARA